MRLLLLRLPIGFLALLVSLLLRPAAAHAYSVLSHQALIDASWDSVLKPLLKAKYPGATEAQLQEAHAYAYGGAITPDMGYYPFGSKLFTNLTHYVRSGDFVTALVQKAHTLNSYAFALGSLCHYHADVYGHRIGTNPSVPLIYPKERKKFGDKVTYAEDPISHVRTEFAFDVLQTARGNYATKAYHDFIGFAVDTAVLGEAFLATYGLRLQDVFGNFPRALNTFRWSVAHFFPAITKAAWASRKGQIREGNPTATGRNFRFRMSRRNYNKQYGREYDHPGFFSNAAALLIRILPKVGPLRVLRFRAPGPEAEKLFIRSFDTVLVRYRQTVGTLQAGRLRLVNKDYDTGQHTEPGEYRLADEAYDDLLLALKKEAFSGVDGALRTNILRFYEGSGGHPHGGEKLPEITAALQALKEKSGKP